MKDITNREISNSLKRDGLWLKASDLQTLGPSPAPEKKKQSKRKILMHKHANFSSSPGKRHQPHGHSKALAARYQRHGVVCLAGTLYTESRLGHCFLGCSWLQYQGPHGLAASGQTFHSGDSIL